MKSIIKLTTCIVLIAIMFLISCKKIDPVKIPTQLPPPPASSVPYANAGIDQTITLPTDSVALDGSASIGGIISYQWRKVSGPASFSIQNTSAVKTIVKNLVPGVYLFELKVTDSKGVSSNATVQVTVILITHTNKVRIIEYGTDLPLPGVTVEAWLKTGRRLHFVTDANGEFPFDGNEIGLGMVTKAGYWTGLWNINFDPQGFYLNAPITFFPSNVSFDYYSGYISPVDSFVIKLFPKKYITIHIKDSLGLCISNDCNVIFIANALFTQQGTNQTVVAGDGGIPNQQNSWATRLRPYIDTTFQYPVCGNTINTFTIGDYASDSGWFVDYLRRDTVFIPNSSNMVLNITY